MNALRLLFIGLSLTLYATTAMARPVPSPSRLSIQASASARAKAKETSRYDGTAAARVAMRAGEKAQRAQNIDEALESYKKAISLDPNYAEAQSKYVFLRQAAVFLKLRFAHEKLTPEVMSKVTKHGKAVRKELIDRYKSLMKRHSDNPVYPWILGQMFDETDLARQKALCQQAVRIDRNFARGWTCLAGFALFRNNKEKALTYLRRAMHIVPDDEDIAGRYADVLASAGEGHDAELNALLRRFPKSGVIAGAVVIAANKLKPEKARIAALERLRKDPPLSSKTVASHAAQELYPIYLAANLRKARDLAHDLAGPTRKNKQWAGNETFVDGLIKAQDEIDAGHAKAALASLKVVKEKASRDQLVEQNQWYLIEAKALAATGQTADAVAMLRDRFVARPSEAVHQAMVDYGAKMGQSKAAINDALWVALRAQAKSAHPFTLKRLDNESTVSLSDYRGYAVIADFWYPNCGPCRASFPYLDNVAVKFKDKGLTVFAINGIKAQQPFAEPYLRGMGYHFIGLAGDDKIVDAYGVKVYPTTFFIGPKGNILFEIYLHDDATQRSAESAVEFMLSRAKQA